MAKKITEKKTNVKKTTKKVSSNKIVEPVLVEEKVNSEIVVEKEKPLNYEELYKDTITEDEPKNDDEMIEKTKEKIEETKKVNNNGANQRIDNLFGYLWNGQEMDY